MFRKTARLFASAIFAVPLMLGTQSQSAQAQVFEIDARGTVQSVEKTIAHATLPTRIAFRGYPPSITRKMMPPQWKIVVTTIAQRHQIDPTLFEALIWQESRWDPLAMSPKGAIGLTQLMPGTARDLGVDPLDPVANLNGGAQYLKKMLDSFDGDVTMALAAYNAGPMRVRQYRAVPPFVETQAYITSIQQRVAWGKALEE